MVKAMCHSTLQIGGDCEHQKLMRLCNGVDQRGWSCYPAYLHAILLPSVAQLTKHAMCSEDEDQTVGPGINLQQTLIWTVT